jgi:hypothetical protein
MICSGVSRDLNKLSNLKYVCLCVICKQPEFQEKHRRYFDFQRRTGQLPLQKEVGTWFNNL